MRKLNVILLALLTLSALGLVASQYHSRRLFTAIDRAETLQAQISTRWEQLQAHQTELSRASLIDRIARDQLGLTERLPRRTMYILMDHETRMQAVEATQRWKSAQLLERP